jgi:tRNA 2-thiouridine synthesizing protein A
VNPIEVDARGLRCPLPVIRLAAAARDALSGTRIIVLASDPAARHDIPAWCRMRGHELREVSEMSEAYDASGTDAPPAEGAQRAYLRFVVLVRPQSSKAAGTGSGSERSSRAM